MNNIFDKVDTLEWQSVSSEIRDLFEKAVRDSSLTIGFSKDEDFEIRTISMLASLEKADINSSILGGTL
jgi:hypothetical protein